ncbi:MAG: type II secretion system F family protein [Chloroflexi bacterium]|nr:type II secretion system F family protein [Chloroflexota bacterium]
MMYDYVAYNQGEMIRGRLNVTSTSQLEEALARQGYRLLSHKPSLRLPKIEEALPSLFLPKRGEVIAFTRQLATILECGIGLTAGLNILKSQAKSRAFRRVLGTILDDLGQGEAFSAAIAKYPHVFNHLYCRMVGVGEKSGQLEQALRQVASYMEKQGLMMKKITKAMTYPAMVLGLAVLVTIVLVTVALPPMMGVFEQFGSELPATTRALMFITKLFSAHGLVVFGTLGAAIVLGLMYSRRSAGKHLRDRILLRMPVIGSIIITGEVARFSRIMAMLLKAGVTMPDTMELVCQTSNNKVIKAALIEARKELLQGQGLSGPIGKARIFPPLFIQMMVVGEETATLDTTLSTVADAYESETEEKIAMMMTMLEPMMTLAIALVIGFIALSMITPMYSLLGNLK